MFISLFIGQKRILSYIEIHIEKTIYNGDCGNCIKSSLIKRYLRMETTVKNELPRMGSFTDICCPKSYAGEMPAF